MPSTILLIVLAVLLTTAIGAVAYRVSPAHARRRAAWELERTEWRRWISRP
jgi:hypothetical protein